MLILKILKNFFIIFIACSSLVSCEITAPDAEIPDTRVRIVATSFAPYDFSRAVAGDAANVTMLLPPSAESHSYEPTPKDIAAINSADVFVYVGGESDEWIENILSAADMGGGKIQIVTLMYCVTPIEEAALPGMREYDLPEDDLSAEPEYDEHIWTSPKNAVLITEKLRDSFILADSENAGVYRTNADSYIKQLNELDSDFEQIIADGRTKTLIFGDRFPFIYFASEYGLPSYAAFPGCAEGSEPSISTLKFLIDKVNSERLPAVLHIELSSFGQKLSGTIAESADHKTEALLLHACHNISKEEFLAGETYLSIMRSNAAVIEKALG